MKLLIVDDEFNTRKGIIRRLPLSELGITEVCEADDGVNGLKAVSAFKPDIILTDVKMPRMDGVEMISQVRKQFPFCQVIFMSGYSDKEYLLSAIELKALHYIEKPINMNELKNALQASILLCKEELNKKKLIETSRNLIKNELALQFIAKTPEWPSIMQNIAAASLDIPQEGIFVTILLRIIADASAGHMESLKTTFDSIMGKIEKATKHTGVWGVKNDEYLVVHLYGSKNDIHLFSSEKLENACQIIIDEVSSFFPVFLSLGKTVAGIHNIYSTYESAVINIQKAFYYGYNKIIKFNDVLQPPYRFTSQMIETFSDLIINENQSEAVFLIKSLTSDVKRFDTTLVSDCKDYYYRLLQELINASRKYGIKLQEIAAQDTDIWAMVLNFSTLTEMESFLLNQVNLYFQYISDIKANDRAVMNAMQYIRNHYHEESLTLGSISEHTHLSPAYLSSVFRKSTGKTLVKYLNDYRIEKAKELLHKKKLKITDIAAKVGCRDSNYFTKIFRRACGLTPSEYRERLMSDKET